MRATVRPALPAHAYQLLEADAADADDNDRAVEVKWACLCCPRRTPSVRPPARLDGINDADCVQANSGGRRPAAATSASLSDGRVKNGVANTRAPIRSKTSCWT